MPLAERRYTLAKLKQHLKEPSKAKRPARNRKPRTPRQSSPQHAAPLPAPLPVPDVQTVDQAPSLAAYSTPSPDGSTPNGEGAPLAPEQENILAGIPDFIGGEDEAPLAQEADGGSGDVVAELMAQVAFEEQDVKDTLCEFFDYLAEKTSYDKFRLSDRNARMLARPGTQLLNVLWTRLQTIMPDAIGRWCESTPGALGFLTACGLVLAPKVMGYIKFRQQQKAKHASFVQPAQPQPTPAPAPPKRDAGSMIYQETVAA